MAIQMDMLTAIELAMEAEEAARRIYEEGQTKAATSHGRRLFGQLAEFEDSHYRHLKVLLDSLRGSGRYTVYEGTSLAGPAAPEREQNDEPNTDQLLDILNLAIQAEDEAARRYSELAGKTADVSGRMMFEKLSDEERLHARILNDEFYNLSNKGAWSSKSLWSE